MAPTVGREAAIECVSSPTKGAKRRDEGSADASAGLSGELCLLGLPPVLVTTERGALDGEWARRAAGGELMGRGGGEEDKVVTANVGRMGAAGTVLEGGDTATVCTTWCGGGQSTVACAAEANALTVATSGLF